MLQINRKLEYKEQLENEKKKVVRDRNTIKIKKINNSC